MPIQIKGDMHLLHQPVSKPYLLLVLLKPSLDCKWRVIAVSCT